MDPAIVSSGQLTDSRSDSPPHWLKSMDHMTNDWGGSMVPYNLLSGPLGNSATPNTAPMSSHRSSLWAPTSPPPGFNISPLHHPKQREAHKIESKFH